MNRLSVAVIGGGAAGQMAAIRAAQNGHRVTILEKNEKLGKKLFITGKGRCNVTNDCGRDGFFANVIRNPRFLYSAYAAFNERDMMAFLEQNGCPVKVERGQRVFPVSDKSSDVQRALDRALKAAGVEIRLNTDVQGIRTAGSAVTGVDADRGAETFDRVILTTGGLSYPSTGSTGAGFSMARALGHTVTDLYPSLVPLETVESWPFALSGITLKNVRLTAKRGEKTLYAEQGEMLLTHFGVSGPLVLTASAYMAEDPAGVSLFIDLKPAIPEEELHARLQRLIQENPKKAVGGAFSGVLPTRLLDAVFDQARIQPWAPASSFTKEQRQSLVSALKGMRLTVKGARPFSEAVVTRGGVSVKEVKPSTLESKLISGLYLAGEILDVDAFTGGFNLQIAWSTGALAGGSI
ncbi:MAG: NAD(P)/FAD-dependent oxidoreductase [Clostridia bacterium]|nr:NAD(P)/FAD-dependent oxidoreductase [Clostridia bacterium]